MEFLARCLRLRLRPTTMARTNTGRRPATAARHPRRRHGHLHEETSAGRTRATARTRGTTEAASLNAAGPPKSAPLKRKNPRLASAADTIARSRADPTSRAPRVYCDGKGRSASAATLRSESQFYGDYGTDACMQHSA